jgi:hypothetical protein
MAETKKVFYRGVSIIEGWPEKIEAAQRIVSYTLAGQMLSRVRYGDETDDWGANKHACHDCRVIKGEFHVPDCDAEQCPACGGQLISCDCPFDNIPDSSAL